MTVGRDRITASEACIACMLPDMLEFSICQNMHLVCLPCTPGLGKEPLPNGLTHLYCVFHHGHEKNLRCMCIHEKKPRSCFPKPTPDASEGTEEV